MTTEQPGSTPPAPPRPTTVRMVIGGESVDAADGQTFDVVNPATGKVIATAPLGGREDVDRAVAAAQKAFEDRKGWANWAAGKRGRTLVEVRGARQAEHRGARPARDRQRRQADHVVARRGRRGEPRLRLLRRRGEQDLRPDDPGLEARPRPDAARADRRRRADRAVELPDPTWPRGRSGPALAAGNTCDPEARELLPDDGDPARRAGARGGHPGRRPQRRDRPGRHGRRVDRRPSGHRQGRVHRRDDDRPGDHAARLGQREEDLASSSAARARTSSSPTPTSRSSPSESPYCVFDNCGQDCCARSRILVERSAHDRVVELFAEATRNVKVGDPLDDATEVGTLVSAKQRERVKDYIEIGLEEGATLVVGGDRAGRPGAGRRRVPHADGLRRRLERHADRQGGDLRAGRLDHPVRHPRRRRSASRTRRRTACPARSGAATSARRCGRRRASRRA